ncbi:MAG: sulfurtransferase complex subunit TusD [Proteobacteria bacterium]|nr:sulfurtransferase complex subunit TusD [Pseudomonadota bacterium]
MKFVLAVHGAPHNSESGEHALGFANAVLAEGHKIERIFFYHDGVLQALQTQVTPQGETNLAAQWQALAAQGVELAVCIASAIKRGVVNETERERYEQTAATLADGFELVGLGQLIAGIQQSDRYIEFPR